MRKSSLVFFMILGCNQPSTTGNVKCSEANCIAQSAMSITNVTGTGSAGRVRSQLQIEGTGFTGDLTAKLVAAGGSVFDLVIGTAEASSVTVTLPETLRSAVTSSTSPTAFSLVMTSSINGTATRDVSILQGEPGTPGSTGNPGSYTIAAGSGLAATGAALSLDSAGCSDGQALVRQGGAWVCKNVTPQVRLSLTRQNMGSSDPFSFEATCAADEILIGGDCTCDFHGTVSYSGGTNGGTAKPFGPLSPTNTTLCSAPSIFNGTTTCEAILNGPTPVTGSKWRCNAQSNDTLGTNCYAQAFCMKL